MATKVLIVEDERLVAQHIAQLLKNNGYEVCAIASQGDGALKKIAELYPDLVLLDIRIKGEIDGVEVAERIKSLYSIPIVYLTAFSDGETLERAQKTNPQGYVIKPFRREQLLSTVAIAIANHQKQEKSAATSLPMSANHYRLQPTLDYIQNHLDQGITVEFLAGAIGMSTAYFCRFFQKEIGCSPYQFIIQQRVERAKELLLERHLPISEVALRCGFSSHSQLNHHFRNLLGITPKEYRSR
ncbi:MULTISPECIES: response regulator transcription factor [unclassified Synechocystis]|uniref:response regulator transcription factor n=1 Tax=unclassified Synechocystis TaxID=2640012 RepID=UPI00048AAD5E|nr:MULTISPECIES: response regulator transcription factor [unclassified Synechocystis]AIE72541.1 response regulator receiver [Synechocystis sp. PCC 6714]MCT0254460.1 response regulator transcription factor [Synechocystis sp. CS-94]